MSIEREQINECRRLFHLFAVKAFNIVNPGTTFVPTIGALAICRKLAQVENGECQRLIINVPPRSGKSLLASIALPAFVLGRDPTRRIICASYSGDLSSKLARDCRTVMQHSSYRTLFPATKIAGKNTEFEFETAHGGFRFSTSVGGTLTGRGGNLIIIDDPQKPDEAASASARDRVWEWFTQTVGSRLDNKAEDAIAVVMQRLHVDDLSGRLLEAGGWDHLCIPAIAETEQSLDVAEGRSMTRAIGEVLDQTREPLEVLEGIRRELGSATFEAQYQQQPVPETGGLVEWDWFCTYESEPARTRADKLVISWDPAVKDGETNDYTVGIVALVKPNRHVYILDLIRERMSFPALHQRMFTESRKRPNVIHLIEDAAAGSSLLQELRGSHLTVIPFCPRGGKTVRLNAVTPVIEGRRVHLPARAPWIEPFKRELLTFPHGKYNDQVDALSQLLHWACLRYRGPVQGRYTLS
jgi:predicted phage terminase large subunit-like protein